MWPTVYELERLVKDRAREKLRETEHQRLIWEARNARGSRGQGLGILRKFLAARRRGSGSVHADPPGAPVVESPR